MKTIHVLPALLLVASCTHAPVPYGALPTPAQVEWQKMETNMFIHFGPNTFTAAEWGDGTESEDIFNPTDLDCNQWAAVAKAAGFKGMIITAKHHDGFCLWPNPVSNHTVAQSTWKDGKGDVLREMSDACRKADIKFGVYVSPWDRNDPHYGSDEYNDVFVKTIESALGNYGTVYEQWFDGACGEGPNGKRQVYDWPLFNGTVFKMQPNAVIFSDVGPGCRWMGNEEGSAGRTCWSTMNVTGYEPGHAPSQDILNTGEPNGDAWVGSETDVSIRPGWFWKESENSKVKSIQHLLKIYYESVGRNSLLLLNVPADTRGHIHEIDSTRLIEWRAALDEIFSENLANGAAATADNVRGNRFGAARVLDGNYDTYWAAEDDIKSASLVIKLPEERTFNRICLQEYIPLGQRIEAFDIEIENAEGQMVNVASETTVGYKRIVLLPEVTTKKVKINIISALACPTLSEVSLYMDRIYVNEELNSEYENGEILASNKPYVVDMGEKGTFDSFTYAPIHRGRGGVIITYRIEASDDGSSWEEVVGETMFDNIVNNPLPQEVILSNEVSARYFKLVPVRCSGETYGISLLNLKRVQ